MSTIDYSSVQLVVQINSSLETSALYEKYVKKGWSFKQSMGTYGVTLGKLADRPVCVSPWLHEIAGIKVLYVEATSQVVDWVMIENWIKSKVPEGTPIVTDPSNLFAYMNPVVREQKKVNDPDWENKLAG